MKEALTFDDVALVPKYNNIASRTEPSMQSWLTAKFQTSLPIVPANMDTVIGLELAKVINANGGAPILHRFATTQEKIALIHELGEGPCYISCGIKPENIEELKQIYAGTGRNLRGVCLDIAHGHAKNMIDTIKMLKDNYDNKEIIAGNVCSARAYHDLAVAGADAIKVGIGPGAACTTRMVTGFGVPQFTAIQDCAEVAEEMRVPLIADGGIRDSRDIVLALAAGASTVMMGKLFALTNESAAQKRGGDKHTYDTSGNLAFTHYNPLEAKYRGQASQDFQDDFYGGMKKGTVAEGESFWGPVSGSAQELIDSLLGGIRSGFTYGGARSIKELQRKAEFVRVTHSYFLESKPRKG